MGSEVNESPILFGENFATQCNCFKRWARWNVFSGNSNGHQVVREIQQVQRHHPFGKWIQAANMNERTNEDALASVVCNMDHAKGRMGRRSNGSPGCLSVGRGDEVFNKKTSYTAYVDELDC